MTPLLTCPNCERIWLTVDCAALKTVVCDCGQNLALPDERSRAVAAASSAAEATHELLAFAREGNQLGDTAYSVSVGEKLADAFRLAIEAQGGAEDESEARMLAAIAAYLDGEIVTTAPPAAEAVADDILLPHLPETIRAAKRCGIQQSDWITGWHVPWSPRNDNQNAEGPWSDWVELANAILKADAAARAMVRAGEATR
jgi:hypothetical protein